MGGRFGKGDYQKSDNNSVVTSFPLRGCLVVGPLTLQTRPESNPFEGKAGPIIEHTRASEAYQVLEAKNFKKIGGA